MSATIHYNGKLDDRARLEELLDAARFYCAEPRWGYLDVDESIVGQVERAGETYGSESEASAHAEAIPQVFPIDDTLTGISITVHPRSEPLRLTFNRAGELAYYIPLDDRGNYWEIKSFSIQLQAAGFDSHVAVCEFLQLLQNEYMPGLNVYDEANYFETGDSMRLAGSMDDTEAELDQMPTAAQDLAEDEPLAPEVHDKRQFMPSEPQHQHATRFKKKTRERTQ